MSQVMVVSLEDVETTLLPRRTFHNFRAVDVKDYNFKDIQMSNPLIFTEVSCQSACKCTLCRFSSGKSSTGTEMEILPRPGSINSLTITYTPVWPGFFTEEVRVLLMLTIA